MMSDSPVFIVGMNGSGTTMLADSLNRHPTLYIFPDESKVLPYYMKRFSEHGDLRAQENRRALANSIGSTKPYRQANGHKPLIVDDTCLEHCSSFGEVVSCLYRSLAAREAKSRWGDKSPANTFHIEALGSHFPTARFVHIIRDGRDAAQSFHRRWGYSPRHTIWRWKQAVREGRRQGANLGGTRYFEIRYEALTTAPGTYLRQICDFLGLEFHPNLLESSMRYMDTNSEAARAKSIVQNSRKWETYFDARQVETLERLSGKLLAELGYDVTLRGDGIIGPSQLRLLRMRDGVAYTRFFFTNYGVRALPLYIRAVSAAMKQWSVTNYKK